MATWTEQNFGSFKMRFRPYSLTMRHTFTVASYSRNSTPVILLELEYDEIIGYGEASMPPYLGESQESVSRFLSRIDLSAFNSPFQTEEILKYIDSLSPKDTAAKAAVDIALHDIIGKIINQPLYAIWGLNPRKIPSTSFTIGIDKENKIIQKVKEAKDFKILKVKLGLETDRMMVETIRKVTDTPLCADINQGWKDKHEALDMIFWLKEQDVQFIEQPMPKENIDEMAWLTEKSPLPTIADEACQRINDIADLKGVYSGINIKLMKCTGMREAKKMVDVAKALGMKVMLGCMTETSCAISAAAQLAPLADWVDLDGSLLISNDIYEGMKIVNGKCKLSDRPGIGISKI